MISPDDLQAALVAKLKANAALVAALGADAARIKEQEWKGTAFNYPCIRVNRPRLVPYGRGNCAGRDARATINVTAYSQNDSTITAQQLQGLTLAALEGRYLESVALITTPMRATASNPVEPKGEGWGGSVVFSTIVKQK